MPAIQAMRSDALALRAKEDVQEKIPSFFNSVNQSLGQAIVTGQDAAEQLLESRFSAANGVIAQVRQKVSGQGGIAELTAGAGLKIISSALNIVLMIFSKTTTTDIIQIASDIANFMIERKTLQLSWDAAAATYAQWVVQAGYAGQDGGSFFKNTAPSLSPLLGGPVVMMPPTTMTTSRWLRVTIPGPAPVASAIPPAPDSFNSTETSFAFMNGATYTDVTATPPVNPKRFKFMSDVDGDESMTPPPATPTPRQPTQVTVLMDDVMPAGPTSSNDNQPGLSVSGTTTSQDSVAPLFRDAAGNLYLYHTFDFQAPAAPEGTSFIPPSVNNGTINLQTTVIGAGPPPQTANVLFSNASIGAVVAGVGPNTVSNGRPNRSPIQRAMGARGALKYRDAFTPRFTDRRHYAGSALGGVNNYDSYYAWGSVGSISRIGREP